MSHRVFTGQEKGTWAVDVPDLATAVRAVSWCIALGDIKSLMIALDFTVYCISFLLSPSL